MKEIIIILNNNVIIIIIIDGIDGVVGVDGVVVGIGAGVDRCVGVGVNRCVGSRVGGGVGSRVGGGVGGSVGLTMGVASLFANAEATDPVHPESSRIAEASKETLPTTRTIRCINSSLSLGEPRLAG